jgi:hypothetical protein
VLLLLLRRLLDMLFSLPLLGLPPLRRPPVAALLPLPPR